MEKTDSSREKLTKETQQMDRREGYQKVQRGTKPGDQATRRCRGGENLVTREVKGRLPMAGNHGYRPTRTAGEEMKNADMPKAKPPETGTRARETKEGRLKGLSRRGTSGLQTRSETGGKRGFPTSFHQTQHLELVISQRE